MRFSTSAFAPACTSPNHCEADPLRLYPDASDGEAAVTRYRVFPGMELDYRDVHARACRELRDGSGERLEIHHCLEGRVEYRQNGRYFYLSPGDLAVARTSSLPPDSRFPTGHYHGITVTIDPAAAPECLSCILSDVEVRPAALMEKLCPGGTVFTARSSRRVKHVFSELYAVPEDIRKGYLKVKLLELLLFLSTLSPEDGQTPHGCTAAQVSLAEQVKARLLAESDLDPQKLIPAVQRLRGADQEQLRQGLRHVSGSLRPLAADARRGSATTGNRPDGAGHRLSVWL